MTLTPRAVWHSEQAIVTTMRYLLFIWLLHGWCPCQSDCVAETAIDTTRGAVERRHQMIKL